MLLSKATYSAFRLYIFFYQYVCSLGIEPMTFYAANAMLYHWATGATKLNEMSTFGHFILDKTKWWINIIK